MYLYLRNLMDQFVQHPLPPPTPQVTASFSFSVYNLPSEHLEEWLPTSENNKTQ